MYLEFNMIRRKIKEIEVMGWKGNPRYGQIEPCVHYILFERGGRTFQFSFNPFIMLINAE